MSKGTDDLVHVMLTGEEIDVLAVALAESVYPFNGAANAEEASAVVWKYSQDPIKSSLATMLAETKQQQRH